MSYTLSEQEKSLLSAFHDGETSAVEATEARRLLERSPEARAWLRDAGSVRTMSVEAAHRVPLPLTSAKLTGSAIAMAAQKGAVVGGGGFFAAARSPFGLAGAAAILVVGAIFTFRQLQDDPALSPAKEGIGADVRDEHRSIATPVGISDVGELGKSALMIPPITARDLVGFALEGSLPINPERTCYMGMEEGENPEADVIREIEERIATLDRPHVRALDSLAELLRGSVVRLQGNTCAIRSDLPDLRMAVINQLEGATLSSGARRQLTTARQDARENRTQLFTSLEDEIRAMEAQLLNSEAEPYVLIESNEVIGEPTGDRNRISILRMIGPRRQVISVNPQGLHISEPNPSLTVAYATAAPARKRSTPEGKASTTTVKEQTSVTQRVEFDWQSMASEPFMMSVTINLSAGPATTIIVSDDVDTTFQSPRLFIGEDIYSLGTKINALTERLNAEIDPIVNDRRESPEIRAWKILNLRRDYRRELQKLLESLDTELPPDSLQNEEDSTKPNRDPLEEAANHDGQDQEKPLECTCMPWEDCTGLG